MADLASVYSAALIFWCGIKQGFWGPVSLDFRKPQPGRDLPLHLDLQHGYTTLVVGGTTERRSLPERIRSG